MKVQHKSYGEGIVKAINNTVIEVDFGGQMKKFQFPKAFGYYLTTEDPKLQAEIKAAKERAISESKTTSVSSIPTYQIRQANKTQKVSQMLNYSNESGAKIPLVGERAQNISVRSEAEMFEP